MIPLFLLNPSTILHMRRQEAEREKREAIRRIPLCIPYTPNVKWEKELNFTAESWNPLQLFPEVSPGPCGPPDGKSGLVSPGGEWLYVVKTIPKGMQLDTYYGSKRGTVLFDKPVLVPAVHRGQEGRWDGNPFMSITPMELISLRGGTKRAKGSVVVAGLGLGHQLIEVSRRKAVTKLTLVEKSQDLVDWLYPRIKPHLGMEVEVIVGDAWHVLLNMEADVALVDIFENYGGNDWEQSKLRRLCLGIKYIWCWGTASMGD